MMMRKIMRNKFYYKWQLLFLASISLLIGKAFSMQIPDDIKKTVGFVFIQNSSGEFDANGTGFFV